MHSRLLRDAKDLARRLSRGDKRTSSERDRMSLTGRICPLVAIGWYRAAIEVPDFVENAVRCARRFEHRSCGDLQFEPVHR